MTIFVFLGGGILGMISPFISLGLPALKSE